MPTNSHRTTRPYPLSVAHVASADESLGVHHTPKAKTRSQLSRLVQDWTEEESENEALAPTIGMINGIRLSFTLWSLIVVIYWM
jgi:hypothetical protein